MAPQKENPPQPNRNAADRPQQSHSQQTSKERGGTKIVLFGGMGQNSL